jgi:hypothetical protein
MADEAGHQRVRARSSRLRRQTRKNAVKVIMRGVVEASQIGEPPVLVLRSGELTSALLTILATAIALSPESVRSPAAIRKVTEALRRHLQERVAVARASLDFLDFESHCVHAGARNGLDGEIKRRADVIGICPKEDAITSQR